MNISDCKKVSASAGRLRRPVRVCACPPVRGLSACRYSKVTVREYERCIHAPSFRRREDLWRGPGTHAEELRRLREKRGEKIAAVDPGTEQLLGWISVYPDRDAGGVFFALAGIEVLPAWRGNGDRYGAVESGRGLPARAQDRQAEVRDEPAPDMERRAVHAALRDALFMEGGDQDAGGEALALRFLRVGRWMTLS